MLSGVRWLPRAGGRGQLGRFSVDTLVAGGLRAAGSGAAGGEIFTSAAGTAVNVGDFFGYYAKMLRKPAPRTVPTAVARTIAATGGIVEKALGRDTEMIGASIDYIANTGG